MALSDCGQLGLEPLESRMLLAADLAVSSLSTSGFLPDQIAEGHRGEVIVGVSNFGSASGLFDFEGRLSRDMIWGNEDDVVILQTRAQAGVPGGVFNAPYAAFVRVPELPRRGWHYAAVRIDSSDEIAEPNEQNNIYWSGRYFVNKVRRAQVSAGFGPRPVIPKNDSAPRPEDGTDFGAINVANEFVDHRFTVTNTGRATLRLGAPGVTIQGPDASDFSVIEQPGRRRLHWNGVNTAAAGFIIRFDPAAAGTRTAEVVVHTDDPRTPDYRFTITGEGLVVPKIRLGTGAVSLPLPNGLRHTVFQGQNFVGIWNEGSAPLEIGRIRLSNRFGGVLRLQGGGARTLEPGGFSQFFIHFTPSEPGTYDSVLRIPTNIDGLEVIRVPIRASSP